jgi:hypothetical protein
MLTALSPFATLLTCYLLAKILPTICDVQKHIDISQYENHQLDGWKKLKPTAVPTLFDASCLEPKWVELRRGRRGRCYDRSASQGMKGVLIIILIADNCESCFFAVTFQQKLAKMFFRYDALQVFSIHMLQVLIKTPTVLAAESLLHEPVVNSGMINKYSQVSNLRQKYQIHLGLLEMLLYKLQDEVDRFCFPIVSRRTV